MIQHKFTKHYQNHEQHIAGADPGFPRGGANCPGGVNIERIWVPGGGGGRAPLYCDIGLL